MVVMIVFVLGVVGSMPNELAYSVVVVCDDARVGGVGRVNAQEFVKASC